MPLLTLQRPRTGHTNSTIAPCSLTCSGTSWRALPE